MSVRSKRLAHRVSLVSGGFTSVYTCPVGRTAVVHEFGALNNTGGALEVGLGLCLSGQALSSALLFAFSPSLPHLSALGGPGRHIVVGPGDQLVAFVRLSTNTNAQTVYCWAYGSELDGVAP